jgi:hypothetical protein
MSNPKPPAKADLTNDLRQRLAPLATKAVDALRDPEVRARLKSQGEIGIDAVQRWRAGRSEGATEGRSLRLVRQRLGRREQRLRTAVDGLGEQDPGLRAALRPVVDALDGVTKALTLAEALPLRSRRKAHRRWKPFSTGSTSNSSQQLSGLLRATRPTKPERSGRPELGRRFRVIELDADALHGLSQFGEFGENGLEVFDDLGGDHAGCGQIVGVLEALVAKPKDVEAGLVSRRSRRGRSEQGGGS